MTTIFGIDPGIVHTGVVVLRFNGDEYSMEDRVFLGKDAATPADWVYDEMDKDAHVFIESYRPRGNSFGTDGPMRDLLQEFRKELPGARIIDNTGVKNVITRELMQVFGVWDFQTPTHHQDLRSAARIALYGGVKDDTLNKLLYRYAVNQLFPEGVPA